MATIFGVVCSAVSKSIRRIIIPHTDGDLATHANVGLGEEFHQFPDQPDKSIAACATLISAATGITPANTRCAVKDGTGKTISFIHADPAIDVPPPGTTLVITPSSIPVTPSSVA